MKIDKQTKEKIQELQSYEQSLHTLLIQKQAFQLELIETENAISEIEKSDDYVFRIMGNIMVKSDKKNILEDLKKKKDLLSIRLKSIEKQESELTEQSEELKKEIMKKIE